MDDLTPCGAENLDPVRPDNRPGLPEIAYRIGTQPEFVARMHHKIPRQEVIDPETLPPTTSRPLAALRARDTSDPSLALIDAFAASLDVLTFYSERIANEAYVGTAVQRRSMVELARSIGYKLAPGVAASVHVAFTVESADDPYRSVDVPAGIQAMSIPKAKGELPQVFETVEPILARAEWNAIPARTEQDQNLALYWNFDDDGDDGTPDTRNGRIYLFDLDNSFDADEEGDPDLLSFTDAPSLKYYFPLGADLDLEAALDKLMDDHEYNPEIEPVLRAVPVDEICLRGTGLGLKPGNRILATGVKAPEGQDPQVQCGVLQVVSATDDRDYNVTLLVATPHGNPPEAVKRAPAYRAPRLRLLRMPTQRIAFNAANVDSVVRNAVWSGEALSAVVRTQAWPRVKLMRLIRMPRFVDAPETDAAQPGLYALRDDAGFFGCTAPLWETLAKATESRGGASKDPYKDSWDDPQPRTVWTNSQGAKLPGATHVFLEREIKEIVANGWAAMETPDRDVRVFRVAATSTQARSDYGLNGKTTGITFANPDGSDVNIPVPEVASPLNDFQFRTARLFAASQALPLAGTPIREDVAAGATTIDLASLYLDIERGRAISISGNRSDGEGIVDSETLVISEVAHIGGHTRLSLESGPDYSYTRPSVRLNANMALTTHGEMFEETLGSGDASVPNQIFTLAKKPLTFVSADTPDGRASTLTIRVDGISWHEFGSLYDAGPYDRAYEVRLEDDGVSRICFGDGVHGHRLPTGTMNIVASYRTGIGHVGEVVDEAIMQLKTKPLGIRGVVNPSAASGSEEAETLADARSRAPQSVRILGRIVSLTDYQDFAVAFAGIGKARADAIWSGERQTVFLSVAPDKDSALEAEAPVLASLEAAADLIRDGTDLLEVAPYQRRYFQVSARLFKDADYLADTLAAAAREALLAGFGYTARSLAQAVSGAEVIALLQAVPGVIGVDLDVLALLEGDDPEVEGPGTLASILPALAGRQLPPEEGGGLAPAELLTILDSAIVLSVEDAHA
ncbi:MAG TPA: putative baseplate assembly protein [Allosphingosinicella sp.]